MLPNAPTRPPAAVFLTLATPGLVPNKGLVQNSPPKTIKNEAKCTNPTIFLRRFHLDAKRTCAKFASQKQSK